jgi:hypothetical protein
MAKIANDVLPDNFDYKTKPRLQDKPTSDTKSQNLKILLFLTLMLLLAS